MNYFENLKRIRNLAEHGDLAENFTPKVEKIISSLLDDVLTFKEEGFDPFIFFYEDIIQEDLIVDFKTKLGNNPYSDASQYAQSCLNITKTINSLPINVSIGNWLQNMLKFSDYIVVDFIQNVKNDKIDKKDFKGTKAYNFKEERLRYQKLKIIKESKEIGNFLDELYDLRNRLMHNTIIKKKEGHVLRLQNFNEIKKQIIRKCPIIFIKFKGLYSSN